MYNVIMLREKNKFDLFITIIKSLCKSEINLFNYCFHIDSNYILLFFNLTFYKLLYFRFFNNIK